MSARLPLDRDRIAAFCRKWKVKELSLFGSVLTDEFRPDSDVDLLVVFEQDAAWDVWDVLHAQDELTQLLGRDVDLVEKRALKNPFRRHHILSNREVVYAG